MPIDDNPHSSIQSAIKMAEIIRKKQERGDYIPPKYIEKYSITPIDIIEKTRVTIELGNLYRRYNNIYLLGLMDALSILEMNADSKEVAIRVLKSIITDITTIETAGRKKCAESSE